MANWLLYGANGYTGRLMAEQAVERGHSPTLAGRSEAKVRPIAEKLGLDWVIVDLNDEKKLHKTVAPFDLVMHTAGPFMHTARPMIKACLTRNTHYLDITGEIDVFEYTFSHFHEAESAGIVLMSGAGFDVIPTDCMARYVADKMPDATDLKLAFHSTGGISPGTSKTMVESAGSAGGAIRRDGVLQHYPTGQGARKVQFSHKELSAVPIPWGDLVTAFHSTGIPNITTYMAMPESQIQRMQQFGWMMGALNIRPIKKMALRYIDKNIHGPDENTRETGKSYIWAKATNDNGESAEAWLETMEGYKLTVLGGLRCVERVLDSNLKGAYTPAGAFGADLVMELPGSVRYDHLPQKISV